MIICSVCKTPTKHPNHCDICGYVPTIDTELPILPRFPRTPSYITQTKVNETPVPKIVDKNGYLLVKTV